MMPLPSAIKNFRLILILCFGISAALVRAQDTDGDLLSNADEVNIYGTNPNLSDTDGDSNPDGFEIAKGTNPKDPNSKTLRPNILFIFCDDMGYGDVGVLHQNQRAANGQKAFKTPFIDRMATGGMILDRHYCPAPVCAPSRASLLSGLHQGHASVRDSAFDDPLPDNHTLASTLRSVGYATHIIGKWGLQGAGTDPASWPAYPTKRGFDSFYGYVRHEDGHIHYPDFVWAIGDSTRHRSKKELYDNNTNVSADLDKCFTPDLFTARAKKLIIDEVNDGDQQPFFIYLAYDTPHAALQIPTVAYPGENLADDLDDSGLGVAGGVQYIGTPGSVINTATGTEDSYYHPDYTGKGWSNVEERFATLIRRMDDCVGDLRKTLTDLGIADNTLIVFTSDNGPHDKSYITGSSYAPTSFQTYGPFEGEKRDCWEGGIREPSIVCWPGTIPANTTSHQISQFHDWLPTFCDLAGISPPAKTDGVSLKPTLLDPSTTGQKPPTTYIEFHEPSSTSTYADFSNHGSTSRGQNQVIFLEGYKGIRNNPASHAVNFQIYDVAHDLKEANNLAGTTSYFTGLQQRMKDRVLQIRRVNATFPRPWDSANVPPPTTLPALTNGLFYQTHTGLWPWIPEFSELSATASGTFGSGINLSVLPATTLQKGMLVTGYINIPTAGAWTFSLTSDSGAFVRIHDITVIDDDFKHTGSEVSGTVNLASGKHPIRIYYRNVDSATPALDLKWTGPGIGKVSIPSSAYFTTGAANNAPVALDDFAETTAISTPETVVITPLANDTDDGIPEPLFITSFVQPAYGTISRLEGGLAYTPSVGFFGDDSFTYTITDGHLNASATATITTAIDLPDIWLPFDEAGGTATHRASGAFAGTLSPGVVRIIGKNGHALSFDGDNSEFSLPGLPSLPAGNAARTIMAWVRVQPGLTLTDYQTILGYGTNVPSGRFTFRLNGDSSSSNDGRLRLEVGMSSAIATTNLNDGQWHHVAAVVPDITDADVGDTIFYVGGVQDAVSTATSNPAPLNTTAGTTATVGGSNHSTNYTFKGDIDDLRIYPTALNAGEVAAVANAGPTAQVAWHRRYFGDAAPTSWTLDDDGDGFNRAAEFAFGGDPHLADASSIAPITSFNSVSGKLEIIYNRRFPATVHGLTYTFEASRDLATWNLPVNELGNSVISERDSIEKVMAETEFSDQEESTQFIRLKTTLSN